MRCKGDEGEIQHIMRGIMKARAVMMMMMIMMIMMVMIMMIYIGQCAWTHLLVESMPLLQHKLAIHLPACTHNTTQHNTTRHTNAHKSQNSIESNNRLKT